MAIYKPLYLPEFFKQAKKFRHLSKLVERKVRQICDDPYRAAKSESLVGNLRGLRSARLTKNLRIIFAVSEECPDQFHLPPKTVVFYTLGTHEEVY
ncbi:MAG: hypothetical protein HY401_04580 [Elusimicrobia bacterium]|nr:hypothetical protein [Elusimicrobiota bacterium]